LVRSSTKIARANEIWSPYFQEVLEILNCPRLKLQDNSIVTWSEKYDSMLECVIKEIGQARGTVIITLKDSQGLFPGQRREYLEYLSKEKLAGKRYQTRDARAVTNGTCPLCGAPDVSLYPNALKGAGLNLKNVDRAGGLSRT
jgi:CRISPR-associated protein Csh1